jgi:proline iminopeptidase
MPTPCRIDTAILLLSALVGCTTSHLAPLPTEKGWLEANGATLYYRTFGAGEPIVVLHGGPGFDHRQFLPHIEVLASDHKVILFDQRGTGLSSGPVDSASITIENFIDDIETVRKAFGIERMNLLGHSWGGVLAMYYAIHHPDRLRSLILCSTTASIDGFNAMRAAIARARSPDDTRQLEQIEATDAFRHNDPKAVEQFWRVYFRPYFPDPSMVSKLDLTFTENTLQNSSTVARLILASVGPFDLRDSLRALRVPTLILHGDSDLLPLAYARRIQASIPGAELRVMRNAGHWIFVDATDQFRASIETFLSDLRSSRPQGHQRQVETERLP